MHYKCTVCKYITSRKSSMDRHNESQKHIEKVTQVEKCENDPKIIIKILKKSEKPKKDTSNKIKCLHCFALFATLSNLNRHNKKCHPGSQNIAPTKERMLETKNAELTNQVINLLKQQVEDKDRALQQNAKIMQEHAEDKKNSDALYQKLLKDAGNVIVKSTSALTYIASKYPNAPKIKQIENFSELAQEEDLGKTLIHFYNDDRLTDYLGDIIIEYYKNDDNPMDQSLWNSDTNRLTYIIKTTIQGKLDWHIDKDAVRLIKHILQPILLNIRTEIYNRVKNEPVTSSQYVELQTSAMKIIADIDKEVLARDIAKYMAPKFQIDKI